MLRLGFRLASPFLARARCGARCIVSRSRPCGCCRDAAARCGGPERLAVESVRPSLSRTRLGSRPAFDKDGEAIDGCLRLGFGFVEIGGVTPLPQPGNARPRLFRLPADEAVINRYGLNSGGVAAISTQRAARGGAARRASSG